MAEFPVSQKESFWQVRPVPQGWQHRVGVGVVTSDWLLLSNW